MQRPSEQLLPPLAVPDGRQLIGVLLAALALWLLVRPYYGISHDALLYAATALSRLAPAAFASDFYLTRNASDAYSLFPNLYALAIDRFGLDAATRGLLLAGFALWIGAAAVLCLSLLRGGAALLAIVLVCVLPARYGSFDILAYGEPYLTPRLFAEAFSLFALAALLRGRLWLTAVLLGAAGLLHPLMTLPALGVAVFYLALQDRRWLWLVLAGPVLAVGLAAAGLAPFDRLLQTFDAAWLAVIRFRTPYLFFDSWSYWNWANLAIDLLLTGLAAATLTGRARRLLLAMLATAALAYVLSALAVDIAHNLLITQLQTWRAGWLLRAIAFLALAEILFELRRRREPQARRTLAIFALAALTLALEHQANLMAVCTLLIVLLAVPGYLALLRNRSLRFGRALDLVCLSLAAGLMLIVLATAVGHSIAWRGQMADSGLGVLMTNEFVFHWIAIAAAAVLSWSLLYPGVSGRSQFAAAATGLALLAAVAGWDRRPDWDRALEEQNIDVTALRQSIAPNESVYWERGTAMVWFVLQRPNYFSPTQGSGIVFDRDAAMIFARRRQLLEPLGTDDARSPFTGSEVRNSAGRDVTAAAIAQVCSSGGAPDHLVLSAAVEGLPHDVWVAPVPAPTFVFRDGAYRFRPIASFYRYACAQVRPATATRLHRRRYMQTTAHVGKSSSSIGGIDRD